MSHPTRRDLLKGGLLATAGSLLPPSLLEALDAPAAGVTVPPTAPADAPSPRERLLLDPDWRFHLGDADVMARDFGFGSTDVFAKSGGVFLPGPSDPKFDTAGWQPVTLPHDWAVELPFVNEPRLRGHGYKPLGRDHPATSIGWYRRTFDLPAGDAGRRLAVAFDGVFRDCIVALNGHFLGRNLSGYAPFQYDISAVANYGGANVLVVRVDATESEGWFYEGAGIYRHVWLLKSNPVHVPEGGVFVRADVAPRDGIASSAALHITTDLVNDSDAPVTCHVVSTVHDPSGVTVAELRSPPMLLEAGGRSTVPQHVTVAAPTLWSVETPHRYTLVTAVVDGRGTVLDRLDTPFGVRSIHFDPDRGFFLNGRRVELLGTCNHQDHAGVGTALPDALHDYRVRQLRAMGANAYRSAHNPPSPALLDACDRLGMLLVDETRMFSAEPEGLSQLGRMIRRDRNHPCVIAWSIANEEQRVQWNETGTRIARDMRRLVRRLDPSRPVTAAMDRGYGKGITLVLDVQGVNYQRHDLDAFHRDHPRLPVMGTETASAFSTRGIYVTDAARCHISAYDVNAPDYGATAERWWNYFAPRPWLAGGFVWSGFDYRGEPAPYDWPCISSQFGVLDTCGFPKDTFHYYRACWTDQPVLHLFPHWNWHGSEGREIDVWVYSNLDRVELLLNGRSLGTQPVVRTGHLAWKVPYTPGALEARGYRTGAPVLTARHDTSGPPARLIVHADRATLDADGEDVTVVDVRAVDAQGRPVPTADAAVAFTVRGGTVLGVGNGDPSSHEPDRADRRRLFNGRCAAIVQARRVAGPIRVEAASPGMASGAVTITARPARPRPAA